MASPELDEIAARSARIDALAALAKGGGMTPARLQEPRYEALLALMGHIPASERADRLFNIFRNVATTTQQRSPMGITEGLKPLEREAVDIAAACELLGLTDEKLFATKQGREKYALYKPKERGSSWYIRRLRASEWLGVDDRTILRRLKKQQLWPPLLVAVERQLAREWQIEATPAPIENEKPTGSDAPLIAGDNERNLDQDTDTSPTDPKPDESSEQTREHADPMSDSAPQLEIDTGTSGYSAQDWPKRLAEAFERRLVRALLLGAFVLVAEAAIFYYLLPGISWRPLLLVDQVLPFVMPLLTMMGVALYRRWRRVGNGILVSIALVTALVAYGQAWRYSIETERGKDIAATAQRGDVIYDENFDHTGTCPPDRSTANLPHPLASCELVKNDLHATMTSGFGSQLGIFPSDERLLNTFAERTKKINSYYAETRFRAPQGSPLSACGIVIQVSPLSRTDEGVQPLLFHVRPSYGYLNDGHVGEVLKFPDARGGPEARYEPEVVASGKTVLPFVGKASLIDRISIDSTGWAKLAVSVDSPFPKLLVDNRDAVTSWATPVAKIWRVSVGVLAGSEDSGGTAACEFDYLKVWRLPG